MTSESVLNDVHEGLSSHQEYTEGCEMPLRTLTANAVRDAFNATEAKFLGKGTFGETWRVDSVDGGDAVWAVKLLDPKNFHPGLVKREIDGLSGVRSTRIMKLHDVRTVDVEKVTYTALICEYIPGGEVRDNLSDFGLPSQAEALAFAIELLHAVKQLHDAERVHRDLKPENILLRGGRWDRPVLIDLGLSKGITDTTMTRYPTRVGSLLYMSPEQLRGERARKTSDLWACGVILFEVLAGKHPYVQSISGKTEDDIAEEITGPPSALPAHISPALKAVILRLLSEDAFARSSAQRALKTLREASK